MPNNKDPAVFYKAATIAAQTVSDQDMALINQYALEPLKAEDVFVFKAVLCDNDVDRQFERFTIEALQNMRDLYVGKTIIKDHISSADNQVARIFATELFQPGKAKSDGELYTQLIAHCYMLRTETNADLIKEIQGGIKKEGSAGFMPSSSICSICGTDNRKSYCRHWPGREYEKDKGTEICTFTIKGVSDVYEFSLVAVPAQREAGVSKSYTGETIYEKDLSPEEKEKDNDNNNDEKELLLRARLSAQRIGGIHE